MADQKQQEHKGFVVTHTVVEKWPKDTVITREHLDKAQGVMDAAKTASQRNAAEMEFAYYDNFFHDTERLLKLGAVRPATDDEIKSGKATPQPEGAQMARSLDQAEQELAAARAENDRLRAEYQRRSGETLEGQPVPASDTSDEVRRLREEAERLRQENEILKAQQQSPPTPPPEEVPTAQPVEEEEEMGFRKRRK